MPDSIQQRVEKLRKSAAERYNIKPEQCHVGHLILEGLLEKPMDINQIDAATDMREANLSMALRSMRLASALHKFGMKPGDAVIIIARGHLDMSVAFFACHYMGYTICSIDPEVDLSDMKRLYPIIKPKIVFTIEYGAEKNEESLRANNIDASVVVLDGKQNDLEAFVHMHKGTVINFRPATGFDTAKGAAWLMLTSGTTGPPKPAIIPYDHVLSAVIDWWDGDYDISSNMILTSTQWLTSIIYTVSAPIKAYTRIMSSQPMNPKTLIHMINTYKPEVTAWTPFLLARFVQGPRNVCDLSCFKHILVGGSAVEKHILDEFRKICPARLYLCYGMSELLTAIFDVHDDNIPFKSSGRALSKNQYRLIDEHGKDVTEPNKNGELWFKGYGCFTGYLENPEETRKVLTDDGWLMTGDIFYRDENNYFFFVERKKLLIRYLTFFVSPLEIEEVIKKHPGVSEACVVGIPNPLTMEASVAAIMTKNGQAVDPQEIFDLVNSNLPHKKQLHGGLFFVNSFPTTVSSKINRSKVLKMAIEAERIMPK